MSDRPSSLKMILSLTLIATIAGVLLQLVVTLTKPQIEKNQAEYLKSAIYEVLPHTAQLHALGLENGRLVSTKQPKPTAFIALDKQGKQIGFLFQAQGQGYQELIKILIAYDPTTRRLLGIKVLESKETPGLGDRIITDQDFLSGFHGLQMPLDPAKTGLLHPLQLTRRSKVKKAWQLDGITGATISSKAVVRIVSEGGRKYIPLTHQFIESK